MGNRLFVGNLSYNTSEQELREEFSKCGTLTDVRVIVDRETGRSKGFGFIQFASDAEASAAIQAFHGYELGGRAIAVTEAKEREPRASGARPQYRESVRQAPEPEPDRNSKSSGRKRDNKRWDRRRNDDWG